MRICPSYLSFILYNPIRKALTNREKVLEESGINGSSVVFEVGAGNGFMTEVIARKAKKVYALDLQEGMVRKLAKRMRKFGDKVDIILGDIATYEVSSAFADVVLMYYSFHEVGNQADAAKNISKAIKPGGKLSIYEPTVEVKKSDMQKTVRLFESLGFEKEAERDGTFTRFVRMKKAL
jgi:tRNA A58 N-methylase Trm61